MHWLVALALAAPPLPDDATFVIGAVLGSTDHTLTTETTLHLTHVGGRRYSARIERTTADFEGRERWTYDSSRPLLTDPWPVTQQAAIGALPVVLRVDGAGRPISLDDPEAWTEAARAALAGLGLPGQADDAGAALLDPDGLVANLARDLPGRPPIGAWSRPEELLGVPATRDETCVREIEAEITRYRCTGTLTGSRTVDGVTTTLDDGHAETVVSFDADGLRAVESRWDVIVHVVGPKTESARPLAARRLVVRQ